MKRFREYMNEQIVKSDENTLDPEFLEKKQKKDNVAVGKIENKIEDVDRDLEKAEDIKI